MVKIINHLFYQSLIRGTAEKNVSKVGSLAPPTRLFQLRWNVSVALR